MSGGNGLGQKQRVAILAAGFIKGESGVGSTNGDEGGQGGGEGGRRFLRSVHS